MLPCAGLSHLLNPLQLETPGTKLKFLSQRAKSFQRSSKLAQELILSLHGIGTPHDHVRAEESFFWVTQQAFATLLESIVATRATASVPVLITFDDGNASDAVVALPGLVKRGLKASFFICAGRIGAAHYLDRSALADLLAAGMEIG